MRSFLNWDELATCVGQDIGWSDWLTITQAQIDGFAQATGDHQWIHVDPVRAAQGPFGATVAHGFLTLALIPYFFGTAYTVQTPSMGVNYGLNKVRFLAPVPVDSRLRAHFTLVKSDVIDDNGMQMLWEMSVEREGQAKPVCVAESLLRQYA